MRDKTRFVLKQHNGRNSTRLEITKGGHTITLNHIELARIGMLAEAAMFNRGVYAVRHAEQEEVEILV
jgi:hypothetical protein|tara:strand:+ start:23 stop:226 length:204 start_codon:yes stop_codon:yes gene_type:complete